MRFSSILLALPLVGSVFAAPVAAPETAVAKRDVDYLAVVNKLKTTVTQAGSITVASTEQEVTTVLTTVNSALSQAAVDLNINLGGVASVNLGLLGKRDDVTNEVAQVLEEVLATVNGLVGGIKQELRSIPAVAALLSQLDSALRTILLGLEIVLNGVLQLVANLLSSLGININGLLGGVLSLLNPLVGGLLGGLLS